MPSAAKAKVVRRRAKRYEVVANRAVAAACERFLKAHGIPTGPRGNFNKENR
jgi:hypothetical protein